MGCCRCCCILLLTIVVIIAISGGFFAGFFPYPSHASCRVAWQFGESCSRVQETIANQIELWSSASCTGKQQCGYELISNNGDTIEGKRTTPVAHFTDSFNFKFDRASVGCSVIGFSSSDTWYAVIDFGFNYCNLKNLIIGSKLDDVADYKEESSNANCTMYSIAHCNLYG